MPQSLQKVVLRGKRLLVHLRKIFFRTQMDFKLKKKQIKKQMKKQMKNIRMQKQTLQTDMPDLESEISAAERRNQQGQGLKILRPN